MHDTLVDLLSRLSDSAITKTGVIKWSSPIPSFGDILKADVATLGLNPSNREFVDRAGAELCARERRFPTLRSLGLRAWSEASAFHRAQISAACVQYFSRNPYSWFNHLDQIISFGDASYFGGQSIACHLDLIPYATERKWSELSIGQKESLLDFAGDTLGLLLQASAISVLVLNGRTVVDTLSRISDVEFEEIVMDAWSLPRKNGKDVTGISFTGLVSEIGGVSLGRPIRVLGYNHNIQSSYGVNREVRSAIGTWVADHQPRHML